MHMQSTYQGAQKVDHHDYQLFTRQCICRALSGRDNRLFMRQCICRALIKGLKKSTTMIINSLRVNVYAEHFPIIFIIPFICLPMTILCTNVYPLAYPKGLLNGYVVFSLIYMRAISSCSAPETTLASPAYVAMNWT